MLRRLTEVWLLYVAVGLLAGPVSVQAAPELQADVRLASATTEAVWVGEEVELYLELWTNGLSFGDQLFTLPEVRGGFLLQGDSSTVKLSEARSGTDWQGLRYTLLLYPQAAGRLMVPPFEVRFTARAGFGSEPTPFSFRTGSLEVEARLPDGAAGGALLVTTSDFTLDADWDRRLPDSGPLQLVTGDALTLEVRRRAADVPGMVFGPMAAPQIPGLGIYSDPPAVNDRVNRGVLTGERTDRITFVCEAAGQFEIPQWRFQWWDPERQQLSEKIIPAVLLEVVPNPAFGSAARSEPDAGDGNRYGTTFLAVLVILVIGAALRRFGGLLLHKIRSFGKPGPAAGPGRLTGRLLPLNPRRPPPRPGPESDHRQRQ